MSKLEQLFASQDPQEDMELNYLASFKAPAKITDSVFYIF